MIFIDLYVVVGSKLIVILWNNFCGYVVHQYCLIMGFEGWKVVVKGLKVEGWF